MRTSGPTPSRGLTEATQQLSIPSSLPGPCAPHCPGSPSGARQRQHLSRAGHSFLFLLGVCNFSLLTTRQKLLERAEKTWANQFQLLPFEAQVLGSCLPGAGQPTAPQSPWKQREVGEKPGLQAELDAGANPSSSTYWLGDSAPVECTRNETSHCA